MTDLPNYDDPDQLVSRIPINVEGAKDLDEVTAAGFEAEIAKAHNEVALKAIADEIVAATGYGSSQVLSTSGFAHALAFSGLTRAAALAKQIEGRSAKLSSPGLSTTDDESNHGYREALYDQAPG